MNWRLKQNIIIVELHIKVVFSCTHNTYKYTIDAYCHCFQFGTQIQSVCIYIQLSFIPEILFYNMYYMKNTIALNLFSTIFIFYLSNFSCSLVFFFISL